ncbi:thiol reductase thioredoxin [filamentous cyanobacterium CCP5]|nr:thiol reductase thioredoxin [filamentous cyanobacterium CCP5]
MSTSISEKAFRTEVMDASVPVLVHFWAPWCGLCKMISPLLERFQSEWGGQVRLIDINADENLRLANFYQLTTLPTLMLFERGELLHRIDSFRGREELRQSLDAFMRSRQLQEFIASSVQIPLLDTQLSEL